MHLPVKQHLPSTTTCPFCQADSLDVYLVPSGGRWYVCRTCNFKGDSIEFYAKANQMPVLQDAIMDLAENKILPISKSELHTQTIMTYLTEYVARRKHINSIFDKAQKNFSTPDTRWVQILQDLHLWDGYCSTVWREELGAYVGAIRASELKEMGITVTPRHFAHCIIMPYYELPGKISSFLLVGRKGKMRRVSAHVVDEDNDDGLMMMGTTRPRNDIIIALKDPVLALQLQRKKLNISKHPLPIIVYDDNTRKAWDAIHANRIIHWEQTQTVSLFKQATRHTRSFIAKRPRFAADQRDQYIADHTIAEWLETFSKFSQTWAEAIKDFLLAGEHWQVTEMLSLLELPADKLQKIYEICDPLELTRIKQLLGESSFERFVTVGNLKIAETDGAWWLIRHNDREMVSNAILRIERAVHVIETEENMYEGVILFGNKRVQFREIFEKVERRTGDWMQAVLMKSGAGAPTIARQIQPHIVTLAKKFHEFQYAKRVAKIGWHQDSRTFVFPNFSIAKGKFDETSRSAVIDNNDTPAVKIQTPGPSFGDWDRVLDDRPEWAALWATCAAFMANMLAPVIGGTCHPIGLIGGSGSIASILGQHVAQELGMLTVGVGVLKTPLALAEASTQRYGYPVWLDLYDKNRKSARHLPVETDANVMTSLLEGEATALSVGASWVFVRAARIMTQRASLPSLQGAMRYLAWLQARDFDLPPSTSVVSSILSSLGMWADKELGAHQLLVFEHAQRLLMAPGALGADRSFLHLVYWLQQTQHTTAAQSAFFAAYKTGVPPADEYHLVIDTEADKIYVNLAKIRDALVNAALPRPNLDNAVAALADNAGASGFIPSAEGFIVAGSYWRDEKRKWQQARV